MSGSLPPPDPEGLRPPIPAVPPPPPPAPSTAPPPAPGAVAPETPVVPTLPTLPAAARSAAPTAEEVAAAREASRQMAMRSITQPEATGAQGVPRPRRPHPDATSVLLWGLAGWLCCGLLGPVAWIKGSVARKGLKEFPDRYTGKASILIGMWLGILVTLGLVVGIGLAALESFGVIDLNG